jgi:hypothetical protein
MSVLNYTPEELDAMEAKPETPNVPLEKAITPPAEGLVALQKEEQEALKLKVEEPDELVAEEDNTSEAEEEEAPLPSKKKKKDEMFDKPEKVRISKKTGKPVKQLTEKQLDNLKMAREKGLAKRRALAEAKKKEEQVKKLEKTRHIRQRKAKKMEEEALIMAHAEEEVIEKEKSRWDEEKLVSLMNRTLDTYMDKREKKKQLRTTIPAPAEGYMYYPGQPPQRIVPKPKQVSTRPKSPDPYSGLFGMD